ncbi:RidA family protein [Paracidovorax anthurii]|uniref:Endoribonuclease L-PSP n=1 Tax=Paracidovorax anthurii TaxID=78229 RepID=A0A328ZF96_9BURK|nr:Rid family hydrolase [Paracidovorax anthurii]RAR80996.1 endoribonuclease L-PSP [Paracidovorax anthurii]
MPREAIDTPLFDPIGPYSHAVRAGHLVFVSGTPGIDPASGELAGTTAHEQAGQAFDNVIRLVEDAGGSAADIVAVQVHLVDTADFAEMNRAFARRFKAPYPARTVFGVAALPKRGALLTVSATACLASDKGAP